MLKTTTTAKSKTATEAKSLKVTFEGVELTLTCKARPGVTPNCQVINTGAGCYHGPIVEAFCTTCSETLETKLIKQ